MAGQLGTPETELEKTVEQSVIVALKNLTQEVSTTLDKKNPYNFEIKRQLRNLFDVK